MTVRAQPRWSAEVQTGSPLDLTPWLIDVNLQIGARFGASVTRVTPGAKGKMNLHNPDNLWVPARSTRFSESELARPIPVRCDMVFPNGDTERWWNGFLILGAAHRNIAEESIAADLTDQLTQNATRKIAVTQTGGTVEAVAKKVSAASGLPIQWETLGLEKATISGVTKTQPLGGWVRDLQTAFPAWAWMVPAGDEVDEFMAAKRYVYTGTTIGIDPPTGSRPEITNAAINGGSPRFLDEIRIDPTRSRIELNIASTQTANDRADLSSQWEGRGEFKLEALGQEVSVTNAGLDPSDPYRWTLASVDAQGLARFVRALNDRGNQQTDVTVTFGLPGAGTSKLVIGGMAERRGREQSACLNFRDLHMTGVDEGPDHTRVVNRIVVEDAAKTRGRHGGHNLARGLGDPRGRGPRGLVEPGRHAELEPRPPGGEGPAPDRPPHPPPPAARPRRAHLRRRGEARRRRLC